MQRVLLLMPATSYRAVDFLDAARHLGVEVVVGSNHRQVLDAFSRGGALALSFTSVAEGVSQIAAHAGRYPISSILGADEETIVLAAAASEALGLPHNSAQSVRASHCKYLFRSALARAGMRLPWFRLVSLEELATAAESAVYPCVLKPPELCASRGVIRADDSAAFVAAGERIATILHKSSPATSRFGRALLAEAFIAGREVALEALLVGGRLRPLALFDKPDPMDGPFFQETIYVTPSRLSDDEQRAIITETAHAASALGLTDGPIHAEARINDRSVWMIELAARSIGGLCSRTLRFAGNMKLEELILRHALGLPLESVEREARAAGVMMIPILDAGELRAVAGLDAARNVPGIEDVIINVPIGDQLVPLPEGDRYLGFIFARGDEPGEVEWALRGAYRCLRIEVSS